MNTFTSKQLEEFGVPFDWGQLSEYENRVEVLQEVKPRTVTTIVYENI